MDCNISTKDLLLKPDRTPEEDEQLLDHLDALPKEDFEALKKEIEQEQGKENIHPDVFIVLRREASRRRLQFLP